MRHASVTMFFLFALVTFVTIPFYGSIIEWVLHKYMMHRPWFGFRYPFERHALTHHRIFKADHTYALVHEEDKRTIPMAWWNGPTLVVLGTIPFAAIGALIVHFYSRWSAMLGMTVGAFVGLAIYYAIYEIIHWRMHLPDHRRIEEWWFFRRLNAHHLLHHAHMSKNFNVVFPFADWLFGTLITPWNTGA